MSVCCILLCLHSVDIRLLVNEFLFVFSYGCMFPPCNCEQKGMLYAFFRVIPRRLNFICRRFGTLFHLHRQVCACMNMEPGVPKRRHIKFRSRGITQKKAYNIHDRTKV